MSQQTAVPNPAILKQPIPPSPDPGCQAGEDNRKSDLCAQWKAADASYDAAMYARWQLAIGWIGLILGGITMGAAIAAAVYARRAAVATENTVSIAREGTDAAISAAKAGLQSNSIAISSQRPWVDVFIEVDNRITDFSEERFIVDLTVIVKNYGGRPCIIEGITPALVREPHDLIENGNEVNRAKLELINQKPSDNVISDLIIHGGESRYIHNICVTENTGGSFLWLLALVKVVYRDPLHDRLHMTVRTFSLTSETNDIEPPFVKMMEVDGGYNINLDRITPYPQGSYST